MVYLEDEDGGTRKDAALCCCKLVANSFTGTPMQFSSRTSRAGGKRRRLVEEVYTFSQSSCLSDACPTVIE